MATPSDQPADEQDAHSGARQPAAASSSSSYEMIASDAGASTTVGSSLAREFETWERLTIPSSVPPSDSGYAPSGYEWVPQQADGTTRRDNSVPLLGADVDQTAGASGPGEEAPVVPSSSATAAGSASRLLPLPSAPAQAADEPDGVPDMPQKPAAHSGALQPPAASSSSSYEVIASGGASETQEEQQQPAQPAANADEAGDGSKTQHGSDGDSEDDGDVTVTLLGLGGNDIFPGVAIQVNRDASLGQLQRRAMDAAGVELPWFKGKDIVVGHWVHSFDDAYCCFMRSPQVRKHVGANRLLARVVNRWSPYAEAPWSITPCACVRRARVRMRPAP